MLDALAPFSVFENKKF